MRELDVSKFDNLLPFIKETRKSIEDLCSSEHYSLYFYPKDYKNPNWMAVEKARMPRFVDPFYRSVDTRTPLGRGRMATQQEYWELYKLLYGKTYFNVKNFDDETLQFMNGRAYRTYPSLVRDLHFQLLLLEKHRDHVLYNTRLDSEVGIDILLKHNQKLYGIKLYTETERSLRYKNLKDTERQQEYSNIEFITIPKKMSDKKIGDFYLYGEEEYNNYIVPVINK